MITHVQTFTVNPFAENTYVLTKGPEGGPTEALLIDPGFFYEAEMERLRSYLKAQQATLKAIVLTHAHIDHIVGISRVLSEWPDLPIYRHPEEEENWNRMPSTAAAFGIRLEPLQAQPIALFPASRVPIASFECEVRHVPGHAPGHLVFWFPNDGFVLAGDTLFEGSVGRTDLYRGDFATLEQAIRDQLYTLPDDTVVYPGHGNPTTIGEEAQSNPYVRRL